MISPTDQPHAIAPRRPTDSLTLWLSLGLGSVLLHLVLFIILSVMATRTASVQLDPEPIAIEFVDPNTATVTGSASPNQAIAARPGLPSSSTPLSTQAQPSHARSQPSDLTPPVEQPFVPQPTRQNRLPRRTQLQPTPSSKLPQQPDLSPIPIPPQPNPQPRQPNPANSSQQQPFPSTNPLPESLPDTAPSPSNSTAPLPAATQPPVEGEKITRSVQGESVAVEVFNPHLPSVDVPKQPAQPIGRQKNILLSYSSALANQTLRLQATLVIDQTGSVLSVEKTTLLSLNGAIDPETLNELASQIFRQWQFEPARDIVDGKPAAPQLSNLIIDVQVQLP